MRYTGGMERPPVDVSFPKPPDPRRLKSARTAMTGGLGLGLLVWIAIVVVAVVRDPSLLTFLGAVAGGFVAGLVVAGGAAWFAISMLMPSITPQVSGAEGGKLVTSLQDVLAQIEAVRVETVRKINRDALVFVPLGVAAGAALWFLGQSSKDPGDLGDMVGLVIGGGVVGYVAATFGPSNRYARLYKEKVLPKLAATFGDLSWRPAVMPDIAQLRAEQIFRENGEASADDEIFGTYRNLPLNIVELKITRRQGKTTHTVFNGLLVNLDLPRDTGAVTAVVADDGAIGNFRDRMLASGRQRVALEDPVFEKVYEVYGTDQIAARALLNPAFMERFLALGDRPEWGRPLLLCTGRKLTIAFPKSSSRNLFEPPSFTKPAANREALVKLRDDIAAVLKAADAVIDLDYRFEVQTRQ
ncbi:MAG TPA: DUF3137 domain-containing protein [Hyphomonadaceae bacterium]|nr:DUF3137 domain-containing protein [Hyphomonadaceae bacterium]